MGHQLFQGPAQGGPGRLGARLREQPRHGAMNLPKAASDGGNTAAVALPAIDRAADENAGPVAERNYLHENTRRHHHPSYPAPAGFSSIEGVLQKNRGPTEIILHFFSRFFCFLGFFPLQALDWQPPAATQPLQKKSCLKTDGRFSVRTGLCHNPRMDVEMTGRNEGCESWTVVKRCPGLPARRFAARNDSVCSVSSCLSAFRAQRFGARNDSSAFGHPAETRRWRSHTPEPAGLSGFNHTQSKLIKAIQTQSHTFYETMQAILLFRFPTPRAFRVPLPNPAWAALSPASSFRLRLDPFLPRGLSGPCSMCSFAAKIQFRGTIRDTAKVQKNRLNPTKRIRVFVARAGDAGMTFGRNRAATKAALN